jgi:hypothetical protein
MIDGTLIRDALVAAWQTIPQLVALLAGDTSRIVAYAAEGPSSEAILLGQIADAPKVFVRYDGFERAPDDPTPWTHQLTVAVRSNPAYCTHEQLLLALINGIVPASGLPMKNHQVLDATYPPDIVSARREPDENGVDYFLLAMTVSEIGDN